MKICWLVENTIFALVYHNLHTLYASGTIIAENTLIDTLKDL